MVRLWGYSINPFLGGGSGYALVPRCVIYTLGLSVFEWSETVCE